MSDRRITARRLRVEAAELAMIRPQPEQLGNGEENLYPGRIASYSKGLPHDERGLVEPEAYAMLRRALASRSPADFERIPMGTGGSRKLANPQAGLAYSLAGTDSHALALPPVPRIDEPEHSGEMGELYWMALLRDVHFTDYADDRSVAKAADDLNRFTDFRGPKRDGRVAPETIFRGFTRGDLAGPYLSQFLLKEIAYGTLTVCQRQNTVRADTDYLTDYSAWLASQNGARPQTGPAADPTPRFIRNLRDLGRYVHLDAVYQPYLNACLILLGTGAAPDPGNPYVGSSTQDGFATFGAPHLQCLVTEAAIGALGAIWYQKWFVHRRQRPEEFGGRLHNHATGQARYPIDGEILHSDALERIRTRYRGCLLPQAFPEGSPTHPSYGAGHAAVAGACVTVLKAFFDESFPVCDPKVPDRDGRKLQDYAGADRDALTVGSELDKLASNISLGRNAAGVHWRSDYTESVKLGEAVAIGLLQEQSKLYNEPHSLTLTRFDGRSLEVSGGP